MRESAPDGALVPRRHGLQVRLQPGQSITLPVTLFTRDLRNLPVGEYELHAAYRDLGLTAPVATLRVR